MDLITKILLQTLTPDSVTIVKKQYVLIDDKEVQVGVDIRNTYMNTNIEREYLQQILPSDYYTAIILIWGDVPTIDETSLGIMTM